MNYQLNLQRRRLDNGMTLLTSESHRLPVISLNAFVLAGADRNPEMGAGLAELTSRLLDEGTDSRSGREVSGLVENEGGSLTVFSQQELSGASFTARSESLEAGLDVLHGMLARPAFPESAFQMEKKRLTNDLQALEDEPAAVASRLFNHFIYQGTPLRHPFLGTLESLAGLKRDDVVAFHARNYAPQNTYLIAVGHVEPSRLEEAVQLRFADWRNPDFHPLPMRAPNRQTKPILCESPFPSEQIQIVFGHLGVARADPDFHKLQVLDLILGSGPGFTSRIPRVLRDELGLAYLTYSSVTSSAGLHPGRFIAFLSTSPENRGLALERLVGEIVEVVEGRFSQEELTTAQDFLTGNFVFDFESNYNVARFILSKELFGLGDDYLNRFPERIREVTREDVRRAAMRHIDPGNATTVIVGPKASIPRP